MKKHRLVSLFLSVAMLLGCIITTSAAVVTKNDYTDKQLDSSKYDLRKYTSPFWEGNIVYNEIVQPIENEDGTTPLFPLMYNPSEIVSVKDYTLTKTYKEGVDYALKDGKLYINPNGAIHVMKYTDIHPYTAPAGYGADEWKPYYPQADGSGYEYWTSGKDICKYALAITYIHNDTWDAPKQESQQHNLPKTFEKLLNGDDITIVIAGDSVSTGAMGSGYLGMSPYTDAYPEMSVKALREKYNNDNITLINSAIGGSTSDYSESKINKTIIKHSPDLVILNFGMNDSSYNRVGYSKEQFKSNNAKHIEYIKQTLPDCEILLLSSLYGNRYTFPAERYEEHAEALHELAAKYDGVGVADPQRIQKYLIEVTGIDYVSFTADNMVHPGDFGMRLSAQCVIEALSFADVSEYRDAVISGLYAYIEENNTAESKKKQLYDYVEQIKTRIFDYNDEWDISDVIAEAYDEIDFIISSCDEHEYVDTIVSPTCKTDGYTVSACTVCGYTYEHTPIPCPGTEHIMDSGRVTTSPTYNASGIKTYSCAVCDYETTEIVPMLTNAPSVSGQGMVYLNNDHNYNDLRHQIYKNGSGFIEMDVCPLSIEKYDGTPYVGIWLSGYTITACYNFKTGRAEIAKTDLPMITDNVTVYAAADYEWISSDDENGYNWKKFAVQITGNTVRIYIDGELILEETNSVFTAQDEVALFYTNGEMYLDNIKVGSGDYNPATGIGGSVAVSWDFNSQSNYNSYFDSVDQRHNVPTFIVPTAANITTGHYRHTHSGTAFNTIPAGCDDSGYTEYQCTCCYELYRDNYTDPTCTDGHTLINGTIAVDPTSISVGKRTFECSTCDMTFTQVIPKEPCIKGDVNGDEKINITDASNILKYIAKWEIDINDAAADVNCDDKVTIADVSMILKYIAKWDIVLGK